MVLKLGRIELDTQLTGSNTVEAGVCGFFVDEV